MLRFLKFCTVILAADLHERLEKIDLPEDWGIFFLGCKHLERPLPLAPGLVRVTRAADHHAIAIREEYYNAAMRGLAGYGKRSRPSIRYSDVKMAAIQSWIPTYAAFPNLAWQAVSHSENSGTTQSHYNSVGKQRTDVHAVAGLEIEMKALSPNLRTIDVNDERLVASEKEIPQIECIKCIQAAEVQPPERISHRQPGADEPPGIDFLDGAPAVHELEKTFPLRLYINLSRREDRRTELEYQFALQGLLVERLSAADGRLARNTRRYGVANKYACRLSHRMAIRQARLRGAPAVLIFEDDAILHPKFRRIAEALQPPDDWGILFFGCTHINTPEVVSPGWLKVKQVWSLQAYAVRAKWYDLVLETLAAVGMPGDLADGLGTDVAISHLADEIPMYSVYPNIAWQNEGYSDLVAEDRKPFRDDGQQNRFPHVLRDVNAEMKLQIAGQYGRAALGRTEQVLL